MGGGRWEVGDRGTGGRGDGGTEEYKCSIALSAIPYPLSPTLKPKLRLVASLID